MGNKINLALIGAGPWGKNLARVFNELGILKSICDSSEEILLKNAETYPEITTTSSLSDVLASPDINAIAIAAPAETHYLLAKKALLANKHVFVEKPLAMTVQEGEGLVQISKKLGKVLFVGHILQYHSAVQTVKKCFRKANWASFNTFILIGSIWVKFDTKKIFFGLSLHMIFL